MPEEVERQEAGRSGAPRAMCTRGCVSFLGQPHVPAHMWAGSAPILVRRISGVSSTQQPHCWRNGAHLLVSPIQGLRSNPGHRSDGAYCAPWRVHRSGRP